MKKNTQAVILAAITTALSGGFASAQEQSPPDPLRTALEEKVAGVISSKEARESALRVGRERAVLCSQCHGMDGNSSKPEVPILAGQNPVYLLDQIERFASGKRKDYVMQKLAGSFSEEEKLNLALYYSSVEKKHSSGDPSLAAKGQPLFFRFCQHCHGEDGQGTAGYARLAGQHPAYVAKTLTDFRDRTGDRNNPFMFSFTQVLTDDDIKAVAAHIANLR